MYLIQLIVVVIIPITHAGLLRNIFARDQPPKALPQRATEKDLYFQPSLDFDGDGCYNVAAISIDGTLAEGVPLDASKAPEGGCRDESDLDNQNVYSRQRCNHGLCAYMYDYYFEKDQRAPNQGHVHDWEHIIVWTRDSDRRVTHVSVSQHGGWDTRAAGNVHWDGDGHPQVVYHKDGISTHCFRFAEQGDHDHIENHKKWWIRGPLVGWWGFPTFELRERLQGANFGSASMAIKDSAFSNELSKGRPANSAEWKAFDVNVDDGSPGQP